MPETLKCPTCRTELPPSGHCPKCLIGLGLAAGETASSSVDGAAPREPRHFAGYRLVRQIGCGGMGVVYEAVELDLNRTVALKLILDTQACSPFARRRFLIEAEAAARLDHPNIVPVYHVGEHEDQPFMSMKLVKGESLRAKMNRGEVRLPAGGDGGTKSALIAGQKVIARLIAEVARAVHHAHAQNVVHRDLKPGNILIDAEGAPHLTDFGLAKILDEHHLTMTEPGMIQGTVPYMSPQQVRGEKVTAAVDTYSLGVILYELLTGQLPYRGTTPLETMRLIEEQSSTRPASLNKHIDRDLETICLKCLEKNPGNRYGSTADLAEDLDRWLRNEPIKARPLGPWRSTGRWVKRNPLGAGLITSLAFGMAAAVALIFVTLKKNELDRLRGLDRMEATKQRLQNQMDDLWRTAGKSNQVISVEELADLRGVPAPEAAGAKRFTFAVNIRENPGAQAMAYGPLLEILQMEMSRVLRQPVLFDLKFCKSPQWAFGEIVGTNTDFQRLGAVSFLRAQELSPGVQAVVQEDTGKEGIIAVSRNSPITNLSQFHRRSFGGADDSSTIGQWAKVYLVRAGVLRTNLSHYEVFDEAPDPFDDGTRGRAWADFPTSSSGVSAALKVREGALLLQEDLRDASALIAKLRAGADPVSQFLWSQLSPRAQQTLADVHENPVTQLGVLLDHLNVVIRTNSIFEVRRFADVPFSAETLAWKARNPQGDDLLRLNRLLLEDAYPEITRRQHYDGAPMSTLTFYRSINKGLGLQAVCRFPSTPNVYAARAGLDPRVISAFQQAMTSIRDTDLMQSLPLRPTVGRFLLPDQKGLQDLRAALANEVRQFDGLAPVSPAPLRESAGVDPSPR